MTPPPPVTFKVFSDPKTKGSSRALNVPGRRWPVVVNDNSRSRYWEKCVAVEAKQSYRGDPWGGPVRLDLEFQVRRPRTVEREFPCVKPDIDKLVRPVMDAMTGVIYDDDARVICCSISKIYSNIPGVKVTAFFL